jgi:tetratricopeptide (TPR) repeat protein
LYHINRFGEAIVNFKKALELNPEFPRAHVFLGKIYILQGKPELALTEMTQETDEAWKTYGLILTYDALGRKERDNLLNDFIIKYPKDEMYQIAEIYAFRGDKDKAFAYLEKSYIAKEVRLTYLKGDPLLKNLENDPRYATFLKKMGLSID